MGSCGPDTHRGHLSKCKQSLLSLLAFDILKNIQPYNQAAIETGVRHPYARRSPYHFVDERENAKVLWITQLIRNTTRLTDSHTAIPSIIRA